MKRLLQSVSKRTSENIPRPNKGKEVYELKMKKLDMKQWMIIFMLLSIVIGIFTLKYCQKITIIELEADKKFDQGLQLMIDGVRELDESEDLIYLTWIAEGYGIVRASYKNARFSENKMLFESIDILNNVMTNRINISDIIKQNDFTDIIKTLNKIEYYGDETLLAVILREEINEHTQVEIKE